MKSNTKISKQASRKRNPELSESVMLAKKHEGWKVVASILAGPKRNIREINLNLLADVGKEGETLVVPGKVLSLGEVKGKKKIVALGFSEKAREKLNKAGWEIKTILEEIKLNPNGKGIKVLTNKGK